MVQFTSLRLACEFSDSNNVPFSEWRKAGATKWVSAVGQYQTKTAGIGDDVDLTNGVLFLDDIDVGTRQSGAFYAKVAQGYRVTLRVFTQDNDYFEDNTKESKAASKNNLITRNANFFDSELIVTMFEDDYISLDIDEEESGIFRYRLKLNDEFVNVNDPDKINDETWIELIEARLVEGDSDEVKVNDDDYINNDQLFDEDGNLIDDDITDDIQVDDDEDDDNDDDDDEKKSDPLSFKGLLIIGAVVIGIVLLLRYARRGENSTKSNAGEGGVSGE